MAVELKRPDACTGTTHITTDVMILCIAWRGQKLCPDIRKLSYFPEYVRANRALCQDRTVLTYWTGGMRCDRGSTVLLQETGAAATQTAEFCLAERKESSANRSASVVVVELSRERQPLFSSFLQTRHNGRIHCWQASTDSSQIV